MRARKLHIILYLLLGIGSIIMILPFYWMVTTSFKPSARIFQYPPEWIPSIVTLRHYANLFTKLAVGTLYKNSAIITVANTAFTTFTAALMGYIFGKFKFKGQNLIFLAILITMIVPSQVYIIPLYLMIVSFKLHDTLAGIIVPYIFTPYAIFLFRQFMYQIPNEIIEAARADGCSEFGIFFRIILPVSKPALSTLTIFYFLFTWNWFLWPLVVLSNKETFTIPVGLALFSSEMQTDYGLLMAGATISILPIVGVFALFQRQVTKGISLTALKG